MKNNKEELIQSHLPNQRKTSAPFQWFVKWILLVAALITWLSMASLNYYLSNSAMEVSTAKTDGGVTYSKCQDPCLWLSGRNGTWVQDFDFAIKYGQYPQPNVVRPGPYYRRTAGKFQPSEDAPMPWHTSWKWVDAECPVSVMNLQNLCAMFVQLQIERILFYGDSITEQQFNSFVNYFGTAHVTLHSIGNATLVCPTTGKNTTHTIPILHRRDTGGQAFQHSPYTPYTLHNDTLEFYREAGDSRVLGIYNIGAHYHNLTNYTKDVHHMTQLLANLNRPQDLLFFRSTAPGHRSCQPHRRGFDWKTGTRIVPLSSYSEYKSKRFEIAKYDWNWFEWYNEYARNYLNGEHKLPIMHYLNIWNTTILRHDAHAAPADCLHWLLPGPVDWWNHLLYSYLQRLVQEQAKANGTQPFNCRRVEP